MGFDIVHVNLHKTFATPHGGGGPGAGPVGVCAKLVKYLPISLVCERPDGSYFLDYDRPHSIGYIAPFYGNFGILLRAYAYILALGREGLLRVAENATLNANYLRFATTRTLEAFINQSGLHRQIGFDFGIGIMYRPFFNNNAVIVLGASALAPLEGFTDVYERSRMLYSTFASLILTY